MVSELYGLLFEVLGVFCHQIPERSWTVLGEQFPLCIRCSALLLGGLLATVTILARLPTPGVRVATLLASPLVIDVAARLAGFYDGNNGLRFATGLSFGFFALVGSLKWLAGRAERAPRIGRSFSPPSPSKTA